MQITAGQWAIVLSVVSLAVLPLLKMLFEKLGVNVNRRTEIDKMYLTRLATVEAQLTGERAEFQKQLKECEKETDGLKSDLQTLRQDNIKGLLAIERLSELQAKLLEVPAIRAYPEILQVIEEDRTGET